MRKGGRWGKDKMGKGGREVKGEGVGGCLRGGMA
jgi:hypothetical protein